MKNARLVSGSIFRAALKEIFKGVFLASTLKLRSGRRLADGHWLVRLIGLGGPNAAHAK